MSRRCTRGLEPQIEALNAHSGTWPRIAAYAARLSRRRPVLDRDFHEEKTTGEDKSIDIVVEIFNVANSGGTKLSKGDLALAKKCAQWPDARAAMRAYLEQWEKEGFSFTLNWLLRDISVVATICRLLHLAGGHFADATEAGRALYWYIHSGLWGRSAGRPRRCSTRTSPRPAGRLAAA
jgi:hypothetical protein